MSGLFAAGCRQPACAWGPPLRIKDLSASSKLTHSSRRRQPSPSNHGRAYAEEAKSRDVLASCRDRHGAIAAHGSALASPPRNENV